MALLGELDLSGAGFLRTIEKLDKGFGDFASKLGGIAAVAGASFGAFAGLSSVVEGFKQSLDLGGTLQDLSSQTGESAGDLVILRQAFDNAGLGAENAGDMLLKLQDAISGVNADGKSTAAALGQLGVSAGELRNLPALEQITKLQAGFEKLDQTARVQVAKDLFGKSGGKALSLFADSGALEQARAQAGPLAGLMDKNVEAFDRLGDAMNGVKLNAQEFFGGALSKAAPALEEIANKLGEIDFVGLGEAFGTLTSWAVKLAGVFTGPLAQGVNLVSTALHGFSSTPTTDAPAKRQFSGFQKLDASSVDMSGSVSSLQKVGLGGGFGGGPDSLLSEVQRQTAEIRGLRADVRQSSPKGATATGAPLI